MISQFNLAVAVRHGLQIVRDDGAVHMLCRHRAIDDLWLFHYKPNTRFAIALQDVPDEIKLKIIQIKLADTGGAPHNCADFTVPDPDWPLPLYDVGWP